MKLAMARFENILNRVQEGGRMTLAEGQEVYALAPWKLWGRPRALCAGASIGQRR